MNISKTPSISASSGYGSTAGYNQSRSNSSATNRAADMAKLAQDQATIQQLASRDREVRAHEQAHASVGGSHAGHPNYQFTSGPNGVRYASSGHVNIDISPVKGDPQATVQKMQQVQRAALAPANPSAQDRAVAAKASAQAAEARAEVQRSKVDERAQEGTQSQARRTSAPEFGSTSGSLIDVTV